MDGQQDRRGPRWIHRGPHHGGDCGWGDRGGGRRSRDRRPRALVSPASSLRSRARMARFRPPTTGIRCTPTSATVLQASHRQRAQPERRAVARGNRAEPV